MGRHGDSGMLVCLGVSLGNAVSPGILEIVDPGASQANYGAFQVAFRSVVCWAQLGQQIRLSLLPESDQ